MQEKLEGINQLEGEVEVRWHDGKSAKFHNIWLRDNCRCETCYYDTTKQKLFSSSAIADGIAPVRLETDGNNVRIEWNQHKHHSSYREDWLRLHAYNPRLVSIEAKVDGELTVLARKHWTVDYIKQNLPKVDYNAVISASDEHPEAIADWCLKTWRYGFTLIDNVPVDPEATEKLCEKITYIRPTHYGGFWDFTSDLAKNDTAYTNFDISAHTDGTYWSDTPGMQLFHLLQHDGTGGTTSLVDVFYCADLLKKKHPEDFELLTRIRVPAHSAGEETVCIQPDIPQPIFTLNEHGKLIQVRWNQSDRSTMDSWENPDDVVKFYRAIRHWLEIISDPENEFFYQMRPGQCLLFDNWRVLHSRTEFTGKRRLCGAYLNRDDFVSRLRLLNLGREAVLNAI